MAIVNYISVDFEVSPRIIWIDTTTSTSISVQNLIDTASNIGALPANMDDDILLESSGKEFLTGDGSVQVGLTVTLNNAKIAFRSLGGPDWILCSIEGGNVVAVEDLAAGTRVYIDVIHPTPFISVERVSSSSATLIEQAAIQYGSYNGGVTVDVGSIYSGIDFPIGTPQEPVNNMIDALTIAVNRGFTKFYIIADITLDSGIDYTEKSFVGESKTKSIITINSSANIEKCEFYDAEIAGVLDGENVLRNCLIGNITYVNGYIEECVLKTGTITLGGSEEAHLLDCWSGVVGLDTPIIDMGGSGQALGIRNYNGGIKLTNKNGSEKISIDLNSGQVILDNTITNGEIIVRGVGHLTDDSTGATVISHDLLSTESISDAVTDAVWDDDVSGRVVVNSAATALKATTYESSISIDSVHGVAGTGWPIGTHFKPVNNLDDALAIMSRGNVDKLLIHTDLTIEATHDVSDLILETEGRMGTTVTFEAGCRTNRTSFRNLNLQGILTNGDEVLIYDCSIYNLENFTGIMNNVAFGQGAEISIGTWATIIQATAGGEPTNEPEINIGTASLNMSHYAGNIKLAGKTGSNRTVVNLSSGNVIIDASCVAGTIQILGTGVIEADNSGPGCKIDIDGFISIDNIWGTSLQDHLDPDSTGEALDKIDKNTTLIPGTL